MVQKGEEKTGPAQVKYLYPVRWCVHMTSKEGDGWGNQRADERTGLIVNSDRVTLIPCPKDVTVAHQPRTNDNVVLGDNY